MHRQETVDCLKKFNARRKLKVTLSELAAKCTIRSLVGLSLGGKQQGGVCGQCCGGDGHLGTPIAKKGKETEWGDSFMWQGLPTAERKPW